MLKELNSAMDYIEEHLTDELLLEDVSKHIGVYDFHFRKTFFYLTNMTLSEYIKYRRMSEANKELLKGKKVTDVAYKYGYQSIDGFSRAFKKWSGILPSEVVKNGLNKELHKMSFVIRIKGGDSMEFKIVEKPAFNFAGVSKQVPIQFEGVNNEIVKLAESITPKQREILRSLQNMEPCEIVNVSYNSDTDFLIEEGNLTHLIGVLTKEEDIDSQLEKLPVSAHTWAVFPNEGVFPQTLQNTMARIYSEWLLSSDYELADSISFSFTKMDSQKPNYAYSEIWIPIVKRKA